MLLRRNTSLISSIITVAESITRFDVEFQRREDSCEFPRLAFCPVHLYFV